MSPRWWHYTLGVKLIQIIADQKIARASAHVLRGERRAVWFSCRQTWEPTATKGHVESTGRRRAATIAEMVRAGGALVRLEVPASIASHGWTDHR